MAPDQLTEKARAVWAKTDRDGMSGKWSALHVHMGDTGEMARILWDRWVSESVRRTVEQDTGLGPDAVEAAVAWLGSVHDIGKACPAFQGKDAALVERVLGPLLRMNPERANPPCKHASVSEAMLRRWLLMRGWGYVAYQCASVIGGHHGANPTSGEVDDFEISICADGYDHVVGDGSWDEVRSELLEYAFRESGAALFEDELAHSALPMNVQVLLTGLVTMADWIASNAYLFPLSVSESWEGCAQRARTAWDKLGLLPAFRFDTHGLGDDELFARRFAGLPDGARLRGFQRTAVEAARGMCAAGEPGIMVLEAPMGCGKTEASLLCAEVLGEEFGCSGIYYALPTQATTNAMYSRVASWLASAAADGGADVADIRLLHGKADLNEDFASLPKWSPAWMGDDARQSDEERLVANQWFGGRKRGLLAPFVVGTVDQLLMGALRTRHVHLRLLGLANKVVVIDEVHAYDRYMSVYLDRVLHLLGKERVPVIVLSATLPSGRREEMLRAYVDGNVPPAPPDAAGYPLVTACGLSGSSRDVRPCEPDGGASEVSLEFVADDDSTLLGVLRDALSDGGCACVLRDTVARAQEAHDMLSRELDCDVELMHARFIAADRAEKDAGLLKRLGPGSGERPDRLVVVATQVVEQSLDVDFDLLVTDAAPVDLLLQRMGRLHRHPRGEAEGGRPPKLRRARCVVTGVSDWGACPPAIAGGPAAVYGKALMWRTLDVLSGRGGRVSLPGDIAPLVEEVYGKMDPAFVRGDWRCAYAVAQREFEQDLQDKEDRACAWRAKRLAGARRGSRRRAPKYPTLDGWTAGGANVDDEAQGAAAVRDGADAVEVVVVRRTGRGLEVLPWVADACGCDPWLGTGAGEPPEAAARAAASCTVNLPRKFGGGSAEEVIRWLEAAGDYGGWRDSVWLKGALPLVLDGDGEAELELRGKAQVLRYTRERGLELVKEGDRR